MNIKNSKIILALVCREWYKAGRENVKCENVKISSVKWVADFLYRKIRKVLTCLTSPLPIFMRSARGRNHGDNQFRKGKNHPQNPGKAQAIRYGKAGLGIESIFGKIRLLRLNIDRRTKMGLTIRAKDKGPRFVGFIDCATIDNNAVMGNNGIPNAFALGATHPVCNYRRFTHRKYYARRDKNYKRNSLCPLWLKK